MLIRSEKVKGKSEDVKRIYFEAFSKEERMPFFMMVTMSQIWNTDFLKFYDSDNTTEDLFIWRNIGIGVCEVSCSR